MPALPTRFLVAFLPGLSVARLAGLAGCLLAVLADAASAAEIPRGAPPKWTAKVDPPALAVVWPASFQFTIPQPQRNEEILFPTSESPFCLVGLDGYESSNAELFNLTTGVSAGKIQGTPEKATKRALSPDGKHLAVSALDRAKVNEVQVWSLETGKLLTTFKADEPTLPMTILDFAGPGEVMTYTFGNLNNQFVYHLRIWDAATGKSLRQFDLSKNLPGEKKFDVSPGRKYFATILNSDVVLYDLENGNTRGLIKPDTKTESGDHVSLESVRFSPDGSEIAVYSDGSKGAIIAVHDLATGNLKFKHQMTGAMKQSLQHPASYKGPALDYVAVPPGFLVSGSGFIERESGKMVWTYQQGTLEFSHWKRTLTPGGLIVSTGGNNNRKIEVIPFPGEKLQKTLAAYHGNAPAIVKPGAKVKINVKVGTVRFGKPDEAKKAIEEALKERLAADGLEVADDATTVFSIDYKEAAGKTLQEYKGGNPIRGGGTPTGKSIQSTNAEVEMKWATKDGKTTIYEQSLSLDPSTLIVRTNEEVTDEVARQKVFGILKVRLAGLPMPYFVPEDRSLPNLPVMTQSEMAQNGSKTKPGVKPPVRRPGR